MGVRRILAFPFVFLLGLTLGGPLLNRFWDRPSNPHQSRQMALQVLNRQPAFYGAGDNRIVEAVRRIEPAVVNIDTVGRSHEETEVPPQFRRDVRGKGSGVILTPDGFIMTNHHVVEGARRIRVTLPDGKWYYARLIGSDLQNDLAVVKIETQGLIPAELGDSDRLSVGEWSIAVGNPLGLGSTITVGVISALNRRNLQLEEGRTLDGAIQTDAAINRGNSGGALANVHGQLIGINTAILSAGPGGGSIGLGFAVPSNTVRRVAQQLIRSGHVEDNRPKEPWLGVHFEPMPEQNDAISVRGEVAGVLVREVLPETPASLAGLRSGDVILAVDGNPIGDGRDLKEAIQRRRVGELATLRLYRPTEKQELEISVTVRERPPSHDR